jgi:hypothetical protein
MEGLMKSLVLLAFVFGEDDRFAWSRGASVIELAINGLQLRRNPMDLVLRSCAKHGVSKDGRWHDLACGRPSRRAQERAPQDEG